MTERTPTSVKNLDRYGNDTMPWSRVRDRLETQPAGPGTPFFLSTVAPDAKPHTASIGTVWLDGVFYFTSNPTTRKSQNLATNPASTIAVGLEGIDAVFAGEATRVTDPDTLAAVVARFREGGWPAEVAGDAVTAPFSAPSAGPPPWHLYRFTFHTVYGVATAEPYGATRWRFDG